MAEAWTEADWVFREIGYADKMQLLVVNDEVVRDVIRGDNGEGSAWLGHRHVAGSGWTYTGTILVGREVALASATFRGAVFRDEFNEDIAGGSNDTWDHFPSNNDASAANTPLAFVRADIDSNYVNSDIGIGHDDDWGSGSGLGFSWVIKYNEPISGVFRWQGNVYNAATSGTDTFTAQPISIQA